MPSFVNRLVASGRDRRIALRHRVRIPLRLCGPGTASFEQSPANPSGMLENLSDTGLFVALQSPLGVGEKVEVVIDLPIQSHEVPERLCFKGHVVRVEPLDSSKGTQGIGIRVDCYEILM